MGELERSANARALGLAIWWVCLVCYSSCDFFYCVLHWAYKKDCLRRQQEKEGPALSCSPLRVFPLPSVFKVQQILYANAKVGM